MSKLKSISFSNSTEIKATNRRFLVIKPVINSTTNELDEDNLIVLKSLTKNTGTEPGACSQLLCNDKIKKTTIGLSNDALWELYVTLALHFGGIDKNKL